MNWAEFFAMGGRGFYVWGSFGAFALALAMEVFLLRRRVNKAQQIAQQMARQVAERKTEQNRVNPSNR